jgi:orotate phosphoribosyltransferase
MGKIVLIINDFTSAGVSSLDALSMTMTSSGLVVCATSDLRV